MAGTTYYIQRVAIEHSDTENTTIAHMFVMDTPNTPETGRWIEVDLTTVVDSAGLTTLLNSYLTAVPYDAPP